MKRYIFVLVSSFLLLFSASPILATTDTSVNDVLGSTSTTQTEAQTSVTTTPDSLKLTMPAQTDNPSTSITFTNPSTDQKAVQLETDSKGFVDISSPYAFPALSIGKHTLEFKYVDESGTTQIYDTSIIIIPRVPILSAPVVEANTIKIAGTGLADSEIILLLSSGSSVISKTGTVDGDGNWTFNFDRSTLPDGVYSINAYIRRYGYASNLSEVTKFTVGEDNSTPKTIGNTFNIQNLQWNDVWQFVKAQQNTIYAAGLALLIGIFIGVLITSKQRKQKEEKNIKVVAEKFTSNKTTEKEPTLREKLMGEAKVIAPKEEISKENVEEEIVTKIDFLKDYKNFDPDNNKGEEVKPKVEVSLTSKKENS